MNNKEIAGNGAPMSLSEQFKWMCKKSSLSPSRSPINRIITVPMSFGIIGITYYTAFGSPRRMSRDLFRWVYMKCGMYRLFAPGDLTISGLRDRIMGRSKEKEKEQEWVRRRSEQMAKDAQDRREATRRAAIIGSTAVSADTPVLMPGAAASTPTLQETGMLAVFQELNNLTPKRARTVDMV